MSRFGHLNALIVEDDEVQQVVIQKLLKAEGIECKAVSNGMEAWSAIKDKGFNFILMDIKMPQHDGFEAVRWIREENDSYYKDIPIFAVSSFSTSGYTQQIKKAGMNEHLIKPLEIEKLLQYLEKYFPAK